MFLGSDDEFAHAVKFDRGFNAKFAKRVRSVSSRIDEEIRRIEAAEALRKQEHDRAFAIMRENGMPDWARTIVFDEAKEAGVPPCDMMSKCRRVPVVRARQKAIYLVKAQKPMLTLTKIGGWFGLDHTTVIHSLAAHAERCGGHKYVSTDITRRRERCLRWHRNNDAARLDNRRASSTAER